MASPETATAAPGADNPQESRVCLKCDTRVVVSPETWPYRKGRQGRYQANGAICLACERKRKLEYESRRGQILQRAKATVPDKGKADETRKALTAASKLDVAQALKAGSVVLNDVAPGVMARIIEYLEDPDHKHHLWAMELCAQRILPRKLYEELGGQAAGTGSLADRRPSITINVRPADSRPASGVVYENGEAELLPSPSEPN